jgi:hypothetical protein
MPYAMAVMGSEMLDEYFKSKPATLGEAILRAKRRMVTPIDEKNALQRTNRLLLDGIAGVLSPARDTLAEERHEHLQLFNLMGDPNLTLSYPGEVTMRLQGEPIPGNTLELQAETPIAGSVTIELLARRDITKVDVAPRDHFDPSNAGLAAWQASYEQANDQVWVRKVVETQPAEEGLLKLSEQLVIPADARGAAHVRVFVEGPRGHAVGVVNVAIKPPLPAAKRDELVTPASR